LTGGWTVDRSRSELTIHRLAIDVSGEPYSDLEREADAMLRRE
jgi:hypothetical protein